MTPSHYLNQCRNIVNWILGNKFHWNLNKNQTLSIQENKFENIFCKNFDKCVSASLCLIFQYECMWEITVHFNIQEAHAHDTISVISSSIQKYAVDSALCIKIINNSFSRAFILSMNARGEPLLIISTWIHMGSRCHNFPYFTIPHTNLS